MIELEERNVQGVRLQEAVAERRSTAAKLERDSQAALNRSAQSHRLWTTIDERLSADRPVGAYVEVERALTRPEDLELADLDLLRSISAQLQPEADRAADGAEQRVPGALAELGIALDPSGRHPSYTLDGGFLTLQIDTRKLLASVSTRGGPTRREPLDAAFVAQTVRQVRERVFDRRKRHVTPAKLLEAYKSVARERGVSLGQDVPIDALRIKVSPKGHPVAADEFNVDLALVIRAASTGDLPRISLSNTRDIQAGLLLHGMEEAGYVGYLRIEGAG